MKIDQHRLVEAEQIDSPNFNARPDDEISLIVIHCISLPPGQFGGDFISQLFTNRLSPSDHPSFEQIHTLEFSAHTLVRRNGKTIQYVPFNQRAWHAGHSNYQGRSDCNDFSIGIELEGDTKQPYTEQQYQTLSELIIALVNQYPDLSLESVTGHSDIAPERKQDPGESFEWNRLRALLHAKKRPEV